MFSREIPFSELTIDRALIYAGMGSGDYVPDADMMDRVEAAIGHIATFARPAYLCRVLPIEGFTATGLTLEGKFFAAGNVITPFFREASHAAVFVATTGREFDAWLHASKDSDDILAQFVADAVGSAFAEAVALALAADLAARAKAEGNRIGNSYSPGYCGWSVRTQQELFALLPPGPCGISLNDSCLMTPIKSISGLIPLGPDVVLHPYGCEICETRNCFRNRNKNL